MSSEKKTFRVPTDAYSALTEMSDDLDINEHKTGIRALERGLSEYGYGEFGPTPDEPHWFSRILVETAKATAYVSVALFAVATFVDPQIGQALLWSAAGILVISILALLGERHAEPVASVLGLPDQPPTSSRPERGEEQ